MMARSAVAYAVDRPPGSRLTVALSGLVLTERVRWKTRFRYVIFNPFDEAAWRPHVETGLKIIRPSSRSRDSGKLGLDSIGEDIGRAGGIGDMLM